MGEGNCAMVRIALLYQHMAIEAAHLRNGKYADAAEGLSGYGKNFTFSDIGTDNAFTVALQAVEGNGTGGNISFQRSAGEVRIASFRLQQAVLNQLVFDSTGRAHLAAGGVATVETHEGISQRIVELTLDVRFINVFRDGIIDIQQGYCIVGQAGADIFAQGWPDGC